MLSEHKTNFIKQTKADSINNASIVKVTKMGNIVEVLHSTRTPDILNEYIKIDKEHFAHIDRETGEILEIRDYKINENRAQNIAGIKRSMKHIRALINNNFFGESNELFITLTYRYVNNKPVTDLKKVSKDFDIFIKRLRRKYDSVEYISVMEPQANTAWHFHLLLKFTNWHSSEQIRLDNNSIIEPLWGHGWTKTKALNNVDNIGAYLSAYLADVEITDTNKEQILETVFSNGRQYEIEEKKFIGEDGKKQSKKYIKGGRLHLYPSGTNIYRCSKGIVKPAQEKMLYSEVKKIVGTRNADFARTIKITDGKNGREVNTITYESYNLKRLEKIPTK